MKEIAQAYPQHLLHYILKFDSRNPAFKYLSLTKPGSLIGNLCLSAYKFDTYLPQRKFISQLIELGLPLVHRVYNSTTDVLEKIEKGGRGAMKGAVEAFFNSYSPQTILSLAGLSETTRAQLTELGPVSYTHLTLPTIYSV